MASQELRRRRPSDRVRVRMYRQGLGDAFLLTIDPGARSEAHVLIDLGTLGKGTGVGMDEVIADIVKVTGKKLAAVVATHEHLDHVSGFPAARAAGLSAGEVWMAWTEDERDADARKLMKYRGDFLEAAVRGFGTLMTSKHPAKDEVCRSVAEVLAFQGHDPGDLAPAAGTLKTRTHGAMNDAAALAPAGQVRFLSPGDVIEPTWAPGVRVFVLGPPRDPRALRQLGEHGSPDLYELAAAAGARIPDVDPPAHPFDRWLEVDELDGPLGESYAADEWRKLDDPGFDSVAELALQLDNLTNNTSLVLAVEIDGDRVLLFAADAQLGSWRTWHDVELTVNAPDGRRKVKGRELLERTVFYKVGHHASHNATATQLGLELMSGRELTAFIPLDEEVAKNKRWPMPAKRLFERLREKTRGRVFRSDNAESREGVVVAKAYVDYLLRAPAAAARHPPAVAARRARR